MRHPPLVAAGAAIPEAMVQAIDLAPTILELARVADPVARQGRSLVPLLRGDEVPWRQSILVEYRSDTVFPRIRDMGYQAVRTTRHKYIHYLELPGMDELYDLEADPYEMSKTSSARRKARRCCRPCRRSSRGCSSRPVSFRHPDGAHPGCANATARHAASFRSRRPGSRWQVHPGACRNRPRRRIRPRRCR